MKTLLPIAFVLASIVGCGTEGEVEGHEVEEILTDGLAQDENADTPDAETPKALPAGFLGNKVCPVSGEQVDPDAFFEHYGEKVYFCNAGCAEDGAKDPDKWVEAVYDLAEPVGNTICPVTKEEASGEEIVTWQGHAVVVCCSMCVQGFAGDPEGYTRDAFASLEE